MSTPQTSVAPGSYDALHEDAVLVDRSSRMRMTFSGAKAKEVLGGLLTNDVVALAADQGQRAVALTPKGRVISVVRVMDRGADLLVDAEAESGEGFATMVRKFVNPRLATFAVITERTACLGIYGPRAGTHLGAALAMDAGALDALAPFAVLRAGAFDLIRSTDLGEKIPGFDLVGDTGAVAALRVSLERSGLGVAPDDVVEIGRVEAGLPRFGRDFDNETIPQEANLDEKNLGAISFNKGCYTGQEVVARIHFRGHVNRHLRWLTSDEPLAVGAAVFLDDASAKEVGEVRSSVRSPKRGPLAIAMVRREVEPGTTLRVRNGAREVVARCEKIAETIA